MTIPFLRNLRAESSDVGEHSCLSPLKAAESAPLLRLALLFWPIAGRLHQIAELAEQIGASAVNRLGMILPKTLAACGAQPPASDRSVDDVDSTSSGKVAGSTADSS